MKTRNLVLVLMLSLAVMLSSGCGKKSSTAVTEAPGAKGTASAPTTATAPAAEPEKAPAVETKPAVDAVKEGCSADMVTTAPGGMTVSGSLAMDGQKKCRIDMGGQIIIVRQDKGKMWMLNKAAKAAMEMPIDPKMVKDLPNSGIDKSKMKLIGTEKVGEYMCDKYKVTDKSVKADTTTWIAKDIGFPVKSEVKTPQGPTVVEFKNIKVGKQSASLFELDPGYKVTKMDMSQMQMPQNMPAPTKP